LIGNYEAYLKTAGQIFSDGTISEKTVNSSAFIKWTFNNSTFHKVDSGRSFFAKCHFNECTFSKVILRRVGFECCTFKNCKIIECDFEEINSYGACTIIVDSQISKVASNLRYPMDCLTNSISL